MIMRLSLPILLCALFFVACSDDAAPQPAAGAGKPEAPAGQPLPKVADHAALRDPTKATLKAPDKFEVAFETTKGNFVVEVERAWAPNGADRFFNLVSIGYYNDVRFFRVVRNFVAQFGMHGDPTVHAAWSANAARIPADRVMKSNMRGTLTYAMQQDPGSRTNQMFINLRDNARLDNSGFAAFGRVSSGMDVVDALYNGYGDGPPQGSGPSQDKISKLGNAYLDEDFPKADAIKSAKIVTK